MVQRRAALFVKGDFDRTSSVTSMLADLRWNTLQEMRMQNKSFMFYRIVHNLVAIPATPSLIPARASRGHDKRFCFPQSTVNAHLYSFSEYNLYMEPVARVCRLSTQLGDLQAATTVQHPAHLDPVPFLACK